MFCIAQGWDVTETNCNGPPVNIGGETNNVLNSYLSYISIFLIRKNCPWNHVSMEISKHFGWNFWSLETTVIDSPLNFLYLGALQNLQYFNKSYNNIDMQAFFVFKSVIIQKKKFIINGEEFIKLHSIFTNEHQLNSNDRYQIHKEVIKYYYNVTT